MWKGVRPQLDCSTRRQANSSARRRNKHVYVAVADGADIERALKTLQDRLWLAGFGYVVVGAAGQILIRSIIDASVYGPERLVFEGEPIVVAPLAQDQEVRRPRVYDGDTIDTATAIPALTELEVGRLAELKAEAARRAEPLVAAARKAWAADFAARHGLSEQEAERIATQATKHVLETEFELEFDDPELGTCTVAKVIANPKRFVGETLADPLEGRAYGHGKAKVLRMHNRCLMIHSFAHGGIKYQLAGQGIRLEDFRAYKPQHTYIYTPDTRTMAGDQRQHHHPTCSAAGCCRQPSARRQRETKNDFRQPVAGSTPLGRTDHLGAGRWRWTSRTGWSPRAAGSSATVSPASTCIYRPTLSRGIRTRPVHGLTTSTKSIPNDADHIVPWLAHRVQHPDHKDQPCDLSSAERRASAKTRCSSPSNTRSGRGTFGKPRPRQVMGRFNGFLKSVILRISEARDLGEFDRYNFYDHMKTYTAAPPDVLRVDEKHLREYSVSTSAASSSRPTTRATASIWTPTIVAITSPGRT